MHVFQVIDLTDFWLRNVPT